MVKNPPADAGDIRDMGSIPGLGRSPGGGPGNPLQYSFLENPLDRRAWRATVHRAAKGRTRLKRMSMHTHVRINDNSCHIKCSGEFTTDQCTIVSTFPHI